MKNFLALLFFLLVSTAHATITRVQVANGATTAQAASISVTVSALTAGNWLVVVLNGASVGKLYTVTLASATDVIQEALVARTASSLTAQIYLYRIITGGATSITIATADITNVDMAAVVAEYSGKNLTPDVWNATNGTSANPVSGTTATTNYANELWIGAIGCRGTFSTAQTSWASAPTNSFTIPTNGQTSSNRNSSNVDRSIVLLEKIVTSTGTADVSVTRAGGSDTYTGAIATFREIPQVVSTVGGK